MYRGEAVFLWSASGIRSGPGLSMAVAPLRRADVGRMAGRMPGWSALEGSAGAAYGLDEAVLRNDLRLFHNDLKELYAAQVRKEVAVA